MTKRRQLAMSIAAIVLCGSASVYATPPGHTTPIGTPPTYGPPGQSGKKPPKKPPSIKAPEIDAASGIQAIALIGGILLLVGERGRRRRSGQVEALLVKNKPVV